MNQTPGYKTIAYIDDMNCDSDIRDVFWNPTLVSDKITAKINKWGISSEKIASMYQKKRSAK